MLQRLALYCTLGLVLDAQALTIVNTGFWCVVALFIANEWITRREVWEDIEQQIELLRKRVRQQESKEASNEHKD